MNFNFYKWKRGILLLGLVYTTAQVSLAQDSVRMTLDEVVTQAMLHSKSIHYALLEEQEKQSVVNQKRVNRLPNILLRGSASYASNMPIYDNGLLHKPSQHEVIHYLYENGADFYLNLYNGQRDKMQVQAARMESKLAQINHVERSAHVKMQVCNLYLDLQQHEGHRDVVKADIVAQQEQLHRMQAMHAAGTVLQSDVLRIEIELSKRELLLSQIEHDILTIQQEIQFITGISSYIVPTDRIFDKTLPSYEEMIAAAKSSAFILQKSEQEVQLRKLAIKQAKSNYLPELGLSSTFQFSNPQIFLYPYNDSWYNLAIVGLKLNIPISSWYKNKPVVQAAEIAYQKEKVKHHEEEEQLQNQLLQAHLDYKLAIQERDVRSRNVALAKENARIIKNRYFKSAALITELLDVDMQYLQTMFELQTATIAIQKHYYFIQYLTGTL